MEKLKTCSSGLSYKDYLVQNDYTSKSIQTYLNVTSRFIEWCQQYGTTAETIDYKTFLRYITHLRTGCHTEHRRSIKARTLKTYIGKLKIYFDYLVSENYRLENIIKELHIKGVKKTIVHNFLEFEELEALYYAYPIHNSKSPFLGNSVLAKKRNKIIIGLLVYQGLNTRDLQLLSVENIQLYKGKINVPATKKSNARELDLKPCQLMEFMEYIHEVRPQILEETNKVTAQLLLPMGRSYNLYNPVYKLAKELKEINKSFTDIKQIRTSVIIHWLQVYGLRRTQYLAGHKYISSTERYQQDDLESLHETINNFHPLQ